SRLIAIEVAPSFMIALRTSWERGSRPPPGSAERRCQTTGRRARLTIHAAGISGESLTWTSAKSRLFRTRRNWRTWAGRRSSSRVRYESDAGAPPSSERWWTNRIGVGRPGPAPLTPAAAPFVRLTPHLRRGRAMSCLGGPRGLAPGHARNGQRVAWRTGVTCRKRHVACTGAAVRGDPRGQAPVEARRARPSPRASSRRRPPDAADDRVADVVDACLAELRVERQGEDLAGEAFGRRQRPRGAPVAPLEARLLVHRNRIVDAGRDALLREVRRESVALGVPDDEEMPDVVRPRPGRLPFEPESCEPLLVPRREPAPRLRPRRKVPQLRPQHRALELRGATVRPGDRMLVLRRAAVVAQGAHPRRERRIPGDHRTRVAVRAEVLPRIEAERGRRGVRAHRPPVIRAAVRLRRVLDDRHAGRGRGQRG